MGRGGLADLDELVLRCRDVRAQTYVRDAVACYRASAYKAAITSIWVGVLYDLVGKIKELAAAGDKQALVRSEEFERYVATQDIVSLQRLEKGILNIALTEFQLLSPLEVDDLERLYQDRNRCAHLAMRTPDEIYEPVAELARFHIHNAVSHVLSRPPVQGKAALEFIWQTIGSPVFPITKDKAIVYLRSGPLNRARPSLVRDVVTGLSADIIGAERPALEKRRQVAALSAVLDMYRGAAEAAIREKLNRILDDPKFNNYSALFRYLGSITGSWGLLSELDKEKCMNYYTFLSSAGKIEIFDDALRVPALAPIVRNSAKLFSAEAIASIVAADFWPDLSIVDRSLEVYLQADSYAETKEFGDKYLIPLIPLMDAPRIDKTLEGMLKNSQISRAASGAQHFRLLLDASADSIDSLRDRWQEAQEFFSRYSTDVHSTRLAIAIRHSLDAPPPPPSSVVPF